MKVNYTLMRPNVYSPASRWGRYMMFILLSLLIHFKAFGQSGTAGNPFTKLGHAWHVPSSGTYHFNISGNIFSTYVVAGNGWILIASGSASTSEASYPTTTSLTLQSDRILPSVIYSSTDIVKVRINATSGPLLPFDVESNHAGVLANLRSDITLSHGTDGTAWTGTGTTRMNKGNCGINASLTTGIYHACDNTSGLHWVVSSNMEKVAWNNSGRNDLNLWIRANAEALPVELYGFAARQDLNQVSLSWFTAAEINNAGFQVQRSADDGKWSDLAFVSGHGTTTATHDYSFMDEKPLPGTNYYRLRQMDFDGQNEFSHVVSIEIKPDGNGIRLFPNPASASVNLEWDGDLTGEATLILYDLGGKAMKTHTLSLNGGRLRIGIDLGGLPPGVYLAELTAGNMRWQQRLVLQ